MSKSCVYSPGDAVVRRIQLKKDEEKSYVSMASSCGRQEGSTPKGQAISLAVEPSVITQSSWLAVILFVLVSAHTPRHTSSTVLLLKKGMKGEAISTEKTIIKEKQQHGNTGTKESTIRHNAQCLPSLGCSCANRRSVACGPGKEDSPIPNSQLLQELLYVSHMPHRR